MNDNLIGSARPKFSQHKWKTEKNIILRFLARPDHCASVFFYLFHNVALFRAFVEVIAIAALIATAIGVFLEFEERSRDRAVRRAMLLVEISQLRSLSIEKRAAPLHAIIEALLKNDRDLRNIDLSDMILSGLDFSEASMSGASFYKAQLLGGKFDKADLRGAQFGNVRIDGTSFRNSNLRGATFGYAINIKRADFSDADLTSVIFSYTTIDDTIVFRDAQLRDSYFVGTTLSHADLSTAQGLSTEQLSAACANPNAPPKLPESVRWKGKDC